MMKLFTFFLDYLGGTYVSQVESRSYEGAPEIWLNQIDVSAISGAPADFVMKISESFDLPPILLEGIRNTWCLSGTVDDNLALIHFTQTET